jgi:hypothetical protein
MLFTKELKSKKAQEGKKGVRKYDLAYIQR